MEIFPNLSNGKFTIKTKDVSQNTILQMINLTGKIIYNQHLIGGEQTVSIDAEYLPHGTYIIRLQTDKTVHTGRIIVRH